MGTVSPAEKVRVSIQSSFVRIWRSLSLDTRALGTFHRLTYVVILLYFVACSSPDKSNPLPNKKPLDINQVLEKHTPELMAIPGVVGTYLGAKGDGTPVIRVMVKVRSKELDAQIPATLEGFPVEEEETGEIRPMNQNG